MDKRGGGQIETKPFRIFPRNFFQLEFGHFQGVGGGAGVGEGRSLFCGNYPTLLFFVEIVQKSVFLSKFSNKTFICENFPTKRNFVEIFQKSYFCGNLLTKQIVVKIFPHIYSFFTNRFLWKF